MQVIFISHLPPVQRTRPGDRSDVQKVRNHGKDGPQRQHRLPCEEPQAPRSVGEREEEARVRARAEAARHGEAELEGAEDAEPARRLQGAQGAGADLAVISSRSARPEAAKNRTFSKTNPFARRAMPGLRWRGFRGRAEPLSGRTECPLPPGGSADQRFCLRTPET